MKIFCRSFLWIILCLYGTASAQYIHVDDTFSAQQLVEDVLIDSPCANVSNFTVTGDPNNGTQHSFGYFSNASSSFPFSEGIVMSTARAKRSEGPNDNLISEGLDDWHGDTDLEQALDIAGTYNATILEFDFTPLTSQISFDYIFASEEYHDNAPCNYSDGFAFLLKVANSTDAYQNLALIPNTDIPVRVTSVHPLIPDVIGGPDGCEAKNPAFFGSYNPPNSPINFNGQTVVLTAKGNVIPGTTYHIKLVIADEQNIKYDSAIFLAGGSFKVGTDIGPDRLLANDNPICAGETHTLDASEPGNANYQYKWFKNNSALIGETAATYTVGTPGTYAVEINLGNGCIAKGEAVMEYASLPILNPQTLIQCDDNNDGVSLFNLTKLNPIFQSSDASIVSVFYHETMPNAENEINPIANPMAYSNVTSNQVFVRAENTFGCASITTVTLQISNNTIASQAPIISCDLDANQDGITGFNISTQIEPPLVSGLPAGLLIQYYISAEDAILQNNPLPNIFRNTNPNQQMIYALIANGTDCYGIVPIQLIINSFDPPELRDETVYLCIGKTIPLEIPNIYPPSNWNDGTIGNSIVVDTPGNYSVTATDSNGCTKIKTFTVLPSESGTITFVDINDFSENGNSVLVHYSGIGNYEFSLDGITFQDNPLFTNVPPGQYAVYINDKNGCDMPPPTLIYVLDYPRYFTPNGDGFHDIWKIENLETQPNAFTYIFDRFGKLLYGFKGNDSGWDGTFHSAVLPASDYWFVLKLQNGRTVKSHFTLKR